MEAETTDTLDSEAMAANQASAMEKVGSQKEKGAIQPKGPLGLTRYVQFAFFALGVIVFWTLDRVITVVWDNFQEPPELTVSLIAAVLAAVICVTLYRNEAVHKFSSEVVAELARVTWPSRDETWAATVVVIVASIIAAVILGGYDALWSALTDLIYKV